NVPRTFMDKSLGAHGGFVAAHSIISYSSCASSTYLPLTYQENCRAKFLATALRASAADVQQVRGYNDCRAAFTVFDISIAMVIGPTPPGTGVIALAFLDTSPNATSPTRRYPRSFAASSTRLMPTSMTTAPSRTCSAFKN